MVEKLILLVEDNPGDIDLTTRAFRKASIGNDLIVAEDGQLAVNLLFGSEDIVSISPVVTLLDLNIPRIDGIEVLLRIHMNEKTRHYPVVVLTSSNEEADLERCYALAVDSYIRKPVSFSQFVEAVQTLQLYWMLMTAPPGARCEAHFTEQSLT